MFDKSQGIRFLGPICIYWLRAKEMIYSNREKHLTEVIPALGLPFALCYPPNTRVVAPLRLPSALEPSEDPECLQNRCVRKDP